MAQCANVELPHLTEGYLGPQAKFFPYGLTTVTHPEPVIHSDSNRVEIVIGMKDRARFTSKLLSVDPKKECNECVFAQMLGDEFHFIIAVPKPGFYKFQVYCLPSDEMGPNMINVYNYLLNVQVCDFFVEPFPKQYPLWKQQGCYLYEPYMLQKGINYQTKFRFFIPSAADVQVKVGDEWNPLEQVEPGVYEGVVDFSKGYPEGTKVRLNVKSGRSNKYDILLEYNL